jgi:hypothetical protein
MKWTAIYELDRDRTYFRGTGAYFVGSIKQVAAANAATAGSPASWLERRAER